MNIGTMLGHRWVQLLPWHQKNWEAWPLSEGDGGGLRSSMAHNLDPCQYHCVSVSLQVAGRTAFVHANFMCIILYTGTVW
jgi:hypothetical protein